jgi:hypothetical protein
MRQKEKSVRKGRQKRGERAHSTLAVDSSWPFFFSGFSNTVRKVGRSVDSDDREPILLISGPGR